MPKPQSAAARATKLKMDKIALREDLRSLSLVLGHQGSKLSSADHDILLNNHQEAIEAIRSVENRLSLLRRQYHDMIKDIAPV